MDNLEKYKADINNIIACLEKLKVDIPTSDNINFINNLREHDGTIEEFGNLLSKVGNNQ